MKLTLALCLLLGLAVISAAQRGPFPGRGRPRFRPGGGRPPFGGAPSNRPGFGGSRPSGEHDCAMVRESNQMSLFQVF